MEYPSFYPDYLPKDVLADFLEAYSVALQLPIWTQAEVIQDSVDYIEDKWILKVRKGSDSRIQTLSANHVIFANGLHTEAREPTLQGSSSFPGTIYHSKEWARHEDKNFTSKDVLVLGVGNTAADVSLDLVNRGVKSVTMIQRSRACVASSTLLHSAISSAYPTSQSVETSDLLALSTPTNLFLSQLRRQVQVVDKKMDGPLISALESRGLKCWWGEEEGGAFSFATGRGAGHVWDGGWSEKVIDGSVKIKSGVEIDSLGEDGMVEFTDGSSQLAHEIILCTGYDSVGFGIQRLLKRKDVDFSQFSLLDSEGELEGCFKPTKLKNLWFSGGSFATVRSLAPLLVSLTRSQSLSIPKNNVSIALTFILQTLHIKAVELGFA